MRCLLIDADSFLFKAASAVEVPTQWDEDLWTLHANMSEGVDHLEKSIAKLKEDLDAEHVVMALSDYKDPWRKKILPTYKANRKAVRKPILLGPLREYLHQQYETVQRDGLEGDDVLGILMTVGRHPSIPEGAQRVCVSIDKDMKTIPGFHFDPGRGAVERHVTTEQADFFHLHQTLTGDTTDGYAGCPGVGAVRADRILEPVQTGVIPADSPEAWALVVEAYEKAKLNEAAAIQQAQVARICRASDYDFKRKEVIPWQPPSAS